jgi:HEAT repeats
MGTNDAAENPDRSRKKRAGRGQSGEPDVYEPEALPDVELSQGDGDWFFEVLSVGDDHISIGTQRRWTLAITAFFCTAVIGGLATVAVTFSAPAGFTGFSLIWLLPAVCSFVYCSWAGYSITVDRAEGVIEERRWFGLKVQRVPLEESGGIISGVMTFHQREVVGTRFVDRDDELLFEIRGTRTVFADSVLTLGFAIDAARLAGLPLRVYYYPKETNSLLKRLVALLRSPSRQAEDEWDERIEELEPRRVLRPAWVLGMVGYMVILPILGLILQGSTLLTIVGVACILCIFAIMGLQTVQEKHHITRFGFAVTGDTAAAVGWAATIIALVPLAVIPFFLGGKGRERAADGGDRVTVTEVGGGKHVSIDIKDRNRQIEGNVKVLQEDDRTEVKRQALSNIAFSGSDERRGERAVLDAIEPTLKHDEPTVRLAAVEAMKSWGVDDTIPLVEPLLKDANAQVRNAAKDAIENLRGRLQRPNPNDEAWIRRVYAGEWSGGRKYARIEIGGRGNPIPLLLKVLNEDKRNEVRAQALKEIAAQGHRPEPSGFQPDVLAAAEPYLTSADPEVRSAAAEVFKSWGTPASVSKLEPLLKDPNNNVRVSAKWAIDDIRRRAGEKTR